jgi:hypothetical protein
MARIAWFCAAHSRCLPARPSDAWTGTPIMAADGRLVWTTPAPPSGRPQVGEDGMFALHYCRASWMAARLEGVTFFAPPQTQKFLSLLRIITIE